MAPSKVHYWIYWGACFATVITWAFAVAAAADDAWLSSNGTTGVALGKDCDDDSACGRYDAATAFQFIATVLVSVALVVVVVAAFSSPPKTGVLGIVLGILLIYFSVCQMIAYSLMAAVITELDNSSIKTGPTFGVAVTGSLLGLAGTITILTLRSCATKDDEGPFRKCMSRGGAVAKGASAVSRGGAVAEGASAVSRGGAMAEGASAVSRGGAVAEGASAVYRGGAVAEGASAGKNVSTCCSSFMAYRVYWSACFATAITWTFAVAAAADDAWLIWNGEPSERLGQDCNLDDSVCILYDAATAFQFMATVMVSVALVVVVIAAFASPPKTGGFGLLLGIMLAYFSIFQIIAFSLMAAVVTELNDIVNARYGVYGYDNFEAGPTLGVAVTGSLLGLAGTIIILVSRKRATNDDAGPFRKCMSGGGAIVGAASAGQHFGTV